MTWPRFWKRPFPVGSQHPTKRAGVREQGTFPVTTITNERAKSRRDSTFRSEKKDSRTRPGDKLTAGGWHKIGGAGHSEPRRPFKRRRAPRRRRHGHHAVCPWCVPEPLLRRAESLEPRPRSRRAPGVRGGGGGRRRDQYLRGAPVQARSSRARRPGPEDQPRGRAHCARSGGGQGARGGIHRPPRQAARSPRQHRLRRRGSGL